MLLKYQFITFLLFTFAILKYFFHSLYLMIRLTLNDSKKCVHSEITDICIPLHIPARVLDFLTSRKSKPESSIVYGALISRLMRPV